MAKIIKFPFEYGSGECRINDQKSPEHIVAYNEEFIRNLYKEHGLQIKKVIFGYWCGRKAQIEALQDVIIAVKE